MVDVDSTKVRKELIEQIQEVVAKHLPLYEERLCHFLNQNEKQIFTKLKEYSFSDGSWYRPIHNIVVTLCALTIAEANRRIILPAAMLHDIGYSFLHLDAYAGPAWQNKDIRKTHSEIGSKEARKILENIGFTKDETSTICQIILTHDNPYIGIPLTTDLERIHRDCDRCFVPSIVSFYKDYCAYKNDIKEFRKNMQPNAFLTLRVSSFFESHTLPTDKTLLAHAESKFEPQTTYKGEQIVETMLTSRKQELDNGILKGTIEAFILQFEKNFVLEMELLFEKLQYSY